MPGLYTNVSHLSNWLISIHALIVLLMHTLFVTFLQFVCVQFSGRHCWSIAVEMCLLLVLTTRYSGWSARRTSPKCSLLLVPTTRYSGWLAIVIRRVVTSLSDIHWKHSCSLSTSVSSALEFFLRRMRYVNRHYLSIYLSIYKLSQLGHYIHW